VGGDVWISVLFVYLKKNVFNFVARPGRPKLGGGKGGGGGGGGKKKRGGGGGGGGGVNCRNLGEGSGGRDFP